MVLPLSQVFGINMMYMFGIIVGNYQYLIQDLCFATGLAAAMALTKPCRRLSIRQPASSLMSAELIVPVLFNFFTTGLFQVRKPGFVRGSGGEGRRLQSRGVLYMPPFALMWPSWCYPKVLHSNTSAYYSRFLDQPWPHGHPCIGRVWLGNADLSNLGVGMFYVPFCVTS